MAKSNNYLQENPTQVFSMRFSQKHAKRLVKLINKKAQDEDRSFPAAIERILVEYFDVKKNAQSDKSNGAIATADA